jgi:hypothetical protein
MNAVWAHPAWQAATAPRYTATGWSHRSLSRSECPRTTSSSRPVPSAPVHPSPIAYTTDDDDDDDADDEVSVVLVTAAAAVEEKVRREDAIMQKLQLLCLRRKREEFIASACRVFFLSFFCLSFPPSYTL